MIDPKILEMVRKDSFILINPCDLSKLFTDSKELCNIIPGNGSPKAKIFVVIGGAWGDEGKGKIATFYAQKADLAIRATGGANAGHTIQYNGQKLSLHLIPGGIAYEHVICLIGQGVALDFEILFKEIEYLKSYDVPNIENRLKISGMATVLMPYHKELDELYEKTRNSKIGTTKRGIGPAYEDKIRRDGLFVYHLFLPVDELEDAIINAVYNHNILFKEYGMDEAIVDAHELAIQYSEYGKKIQNMVVDGHNFVREYVNDPSKTIIVEGAQSVMLSIEVGDRPKVTSSDSNTNGTLSGAHLNITDPTEIIAVFKAYFSKVGNGDFPTEFPSHIDENGNLVPYEPENSLVGDILRNLTGEYGATTGRPRRVGWFDAVIAKYVVEVSGATYLCINHIDSIGKFGMHGGIKICVSYLYQGKIIDRWPADKIVTHEVPKPISFIEMPGWEIKENTKSFEDLPVGAKYFIETIEKYVGKKVKYIGIGPNNDDVIVRDF